MIKLNGNEISSIFYNGNEIVKAYYNNQVVYEKIKGMFVTGTVSNTAYVPRVYVNSSVVSGSSPSGGTWVDTVLEGNTWKIDLSDRLPLTGMSFMFYIESSSSNRNRYIDKIVFPKNIDTSQVTSMYRMFYPASASYTSLASIEGLENFDTSNVTNMNGMFYNCSSITSLDLSNWNTEKVTKMNYMFHNCKKLTSLDLSNWNTEKVTTMNRMFYSCRALTSVEGIENLNTSNVTDMSEMFRQCCLWDKLDLSNWNTEKVTTMENMFGDGGGYGITDYLKTIDIRGIDTSNVTTMSYMFSYRNKLTSIQGIESIDTSNVANMSYMFSDCSSLTSVGDLSNWNTEKVTTMNRMFYGCRALTSVEGIENLNTSNVTNMQQMFSGCSSLTTLGDLSNWNTSKVTIMQAMFGDCNSLSSVGDISNWNTGAVTNMSYMFSGCSSLTSVGDLSNWNTGAVTNMSYMFSGCSSLTSVGDLSNWNTGAVTDMGYMFSGCSSLTSVGDLSNWNTEKVNNMNSMFSGCSSLTTLGDLSNWNTSRVTSMYKMFYLCNNLTTLGMPGIGDGTQSVNVIQMLNQCDRLANIPSCGDIYNTIDFYPCPLTLASAKVVLNALQAPYSGAQSLTFRSTTVNLIQQDQEAIGLVAEKVALGWTINVALPETIFRINAGQVQDGLTVAQVPSGTQVTEYESGKFYQITACTADTVDFSGRDVKTALYLDYPSINTIDVSDNSNLTKLVFNHENTNDMTIKFYNTGMDPDWAETINDLASKNIERSVTLYFGSQLNVGDYKYEADGPVENAYVVFTFNADGTYTDDWYGCNKYEKVINGIISFDDSINQWVPSTYAAPSDAPEISTMYMSDSNWHKASQFAKCYFNVLPQTSDTNVDLYINSYSEPGYDYTIAFSLDTDWTSASNPSSTSTGVIAHTNGFFKDPSGSIATNYKKVSYTIPGDGQAHRILVIYRKDGSGDSYYDRGFVIAPYGISWEPVPAPVKKVEITGTVTDTSKLPSVIFNNLQSSYDSITPTFPQKITSTLEGNNWSVKVNEFNFAAFMFFGGHSANTNDNMYVDTISIPENMLYLKPSTMHAMFFAGNISNDNLRQINGLENIDTSNANTMYRLFCNRNNLNGIAEGIANWDTSKVTNMQYAFYNCKSLELLDLSNWDTHNVTTMNTMFQNCSALTTVGDLSNWDTHNVTTMNTMFQNCSNLATIGLPQIGTQTRYVNSSTMFDFCNNLTTITASGPIYNNLSFRLSPLTIESAKVVLNALQEPYSGAQSLKFSSATMTKILVDPEAQSIAQEKAALGWTISA